MVVGVGGLSWIDRECAIEAMRKFGGHSVVTRTQLLGWLG